MWPFLHLSICHHEPEKIVTEPENGLGKEIRQQEMQKHIGHQNYCFHHIMFLELFRKQSM